MDKVIPPKYLNIVQYVEYAKTTYELLNQMLNSVEKGSKEDIAHALPRLLVLWEYWTYIRGDWNAWSDLHRPPGIDRETQRLFYKVEDDFCARIAKLRKKAGKAGEQEVNEFLERMKTWCSSFKYYSAEKPQQNLCP